MDDDVSEHGRWCKGHRRSCVSGKVAVVLFVTVLLVDRSWAAIWIWIVVSQTDHEVCHTDGCYNNDNIDY